VDSKFCLLLPVREEGRVFCLTGVNNRFHKARRLGVQGKRAKGGSFASGVLATSAKGKLSQRVLKRM